ncbi:MAG TPA: cyclic peptide export ABC transporter [Pyrinomonadaceae bacterium]|jgi:putative ATP-binding cassette transporter
MKLISLLSKYSKGLVILSLLAGVIAGASNAGLIAVINGILSRSELSVSTLTWAFIALCLLAPVSKFVSQTLLVRLSQKVVFDIRMLLSRRILSAPLRRLEELGPHRLLSLLTEDVNVIISALINIPMVCTQMTILIGCAIYLAILSWQLLLIVLVFLVIGMFSYKLLVSRGAPYFKKAREQQDVLFGHFRALTEGSKELKLHRRRRQTFLSDVLERTANSLRQYNVKGSLVFTAAGSGVQFLQFALVGLTLLVIPRFITIDRHVMTGYTLILLYMLIPVDIITSMTPLLSRASIALQKAESLGGRLAADSTEENVNVPLMNERWKSLDLVGVTHTYHREQEDDHFTLGPIDLSFRPGELVFMVGGNGSGKTTLAKLLTGLYYPESGEIRFNGEPITDENREFYRQHFSVVFSDFFLFESLLGLEVPELDERARKYLGQLLLSRKVQVKDGQLSTTQLSQGQRKRLALLTAYLEDRPIYLFDEWAADQDPQFKEVFYLQLLPELKAQNKTVIVISHDDQYYHIADRIIKLDFGQVDFANQFSYLGSAAETSLLADEQAMPIKLRE